jgi:hypothetical protein
MTITKLLLLLGVGETWEVVDIPWQDWDLRWGV